MSKTNQFILKCKKKVRGRCVFFVSRRVLYHSGRVMKCLVWWEDGNQFRRKITYPARVWIQLRHTAVHTWYSDFKCTSGYLWLDFCFPAHIWFYLSKEEKSNNIQLLTNRKQFWAQQQGKRAVLEICILKHGGFILFWFAWPVKEVFVVYDSKIDQEFHK